MPSTSRQLRCTTRLTSVTYLFIIYFSGVFEVIEKTVAGAQALSFADGIGLVAPGHSIREVHGKLQEAAKAAIE